MADSSTGTPLACIHAPHQALYSRVVDLKKHPGIQYLQLFLEFFSLYSLSFSLLDLINDLKKHTNLIKYNKASL